MPLVLFVSTNVSGAMYKCTGADGNVTFSDMPCEGETEERVTQDSLPPINASDSTVYTPIYRKPSRSEVPTEEPTLEPPVVPKMSKEAKCKSLQFEYDKYRQTPLCTSGHRISNSFCITRRDSKGRPLTKGEHRQKIEDMKERLDQECG